MHTFSLFVRAIAVFGLLLAFATAAVAQVTPPTVTTLPATNVTESLATLNGTVNPNGTDTQAWFQFSTSSTFSEYSSTDGQPLGAGTNPVSIQWGPTSPGFLPGTTYYYRASATNTAGQWRLGATLTFTTLPPTHLPTIVSSTASQISNSSALLTAVVNANGPYTHVSFDWGTDPTLTAYTTTDYPYSLAYYSEYPVNMQLPGLSGRSTYYFRARASSVVGTVQSAIHSFTTLGDDQAPIVTTNAAQTTASTAALGATVNPNGLDTTVWFEYSSFPDPPASGTVTSTQQLPAGSANVVMSATLLGLAPKTTYYYRAAAQNAVGTTRGAILSFTTGTAGGPADPRHRKAIRVTKAQVLPAAVDRAVNAVASSAADVRHVTKRSSRRNSQDQDTPK